MCHCWNWPYNNYQQYNKASLCPVRNRRLGRSYNLGSPRGTYQKPFIQGFSSKAWSWGTTSMCIYIYIILRDGNTDGNPCDIKCIILLHWTERHPSAGSCHRRNAGVSTDGWSEYSIDLQLPNDPLLLESLFTSKQLHSFCLRGPSQQIRIQKLGKPTPIRLPFPSEQGPTTKHLCTIWQDFLQHLVLGTWYTLSEQNQVNKWVLWSHDGNLQFQHERNTQQSHTLIYPWTDWFTTFLQLKRQFFSFNHPNTRVSTATFPSLSSFPTISLPISSNLGQIPSAKTSSHSSHVWWDKFFKFHHQLRRHLLGPSWAVIGS